MWCPLCRADVAAELSTDNRRMLCTRCGAELGVAASAASSILKIPATEEMERDARELLSRWSTEDVLETPIPLSKTLANLAHSRDPAEFEREMKSAGMPTAAGASSAFYREIASAIAGTAEVNSAVESGRGEKSRHTTETSHDQHVMRRHGASQTDSAADLPIGDSDAPSGENAVNHHDHHHHEPFQHPPRRPTSGTGVAGQICAYSGVGLLTCGTILVMWSLFGGPPNYMTTGWLTAAVGQMLLFLGIVTIISNGMEQTISEVTWRIDHLAEEVHYMGLALDDLEAEQRKSRLKGRDVTPHESRDDLTRKAA